MVRVKVLHIAECIGGVDRFLRCLMKYANHDEFENIMILSRLYEGRGYENLADKVEITDIPHSMGTEALKTALRIRKKIEKYKPDIVVAHSSIAGGITRIACMGLKCKVIYNPHGWSFNMDSSKKGTYIKIEKLLSHFCDKIVCISDAEKESALRENICKEDMLHVIYNGIDLDEHILGKVDLPDGRFIVGMVGRICKQKAPDIFVKMEKEVKKQIDNAYFVIVGDVLEATLEEKNEIKELAKDLGDDLYITGWVNNPLDYVARFNVGCLLSRWEGFGLAIPEYMSLGIPIVATKVDAIPYLIKDNVTGYLVEKDDWRSAAEKVLKAKDNKVMSEFEKKEVRRFDAKRVSKEYEELYHKL